MPVLSGRFESSVPGLFFVGLAAADSFGPLMRFVAGARFAAPRVVGELARRSDRRRPMSSAVGVGGPAVAPEPAW